MVSIKIPKIKLSPTRSSRKWGTCGVYLQISLQVVALQDLEGTGIHLHRFGVEDHLDGDKV